MSLITIQTGTQLRTKDSYAGSSVIGLAVRSNGEERVKVIDGRGNIYNAGIDAPTVAPTVAVAGSGNLPNDQYCAYLYVYAASGFPFVENALAINGELWPRGNFGPATTLHITGSGNQKVSGTVTGSTDSKIDTIWIFRTTFFADTASATAAAQAGLAFFSSQVVNDTGGGTVAFTDNTLADSTDQVEADNYVAPEFQFGVYYDPYFWGFGNLPFTATASWNNTNTSSTGKITLTAGDTWFDGRNGQNLTLTGITTGGFDGLGTFKFLWLSSTTATVTADGSTPIALPTTGTGMVLIQGPAVTLYRSKPRNPFAWGYTEVDGSANVPQEYAFKVGGGLGTAIAVVPNNATLKLDCEYPAKCYTLNLRAAGTTSFESTLRIISDVYSVSAHFSQFPAVTMQGNTVLWGLDYKNFCIVQSDGITQIPISTPIPKTLRSLTTDRTRQLLAHGVYDPKTEMNCIWVSTAASISLVNYLIYQHAPTGFWGFCDEQDLLCSATIQDTLSSQIRTYGGTQSGFLGQILTQEAMSNWLPNTGLMTGAIVSATSNSITISSSGSAFNTTDDGMVGNWVLTTDPNNGTEQIARISNVTSFTLTFDLVRSYIGGGTTAFNPTPAVGWLFYVGLIECRLLKFFDLNVPQTDKQLMEMWLTQQQVDTNQVDGGTLIRFYRERATTYTQFASLQNIYDDSIGSDAWFVDQDIPAELIKMFGLEIINRGYSQWKFVNMVLKPRLNP